MAATNTSAFELFQQAIAARIRPTIHDCWADFASWELARRFTDDPSHPAKAAIQWIYAMEELRCALDEFQGTAKTDCLEALDEANVSFAKLEHSPELLHAIEKWMEFRLSP
jgi:hypothetical protein